ncbi:MAG TPA: hotdog domain-containing protein [Acidimicrobiales bacterium]|nr:hotdog domain-containing protein [Acidimicrobiales bacterium]
MALTSGLCAQAELEVTEDDTALAVGSGDVPVLATPRLVALCEQAACEALLPQLAPGQTSVGFRVEITHLVPVLVGSRVVAAAAFERVDGKRIVFSVTVTDKCGLVAAGKVVRVLVDTDAFMEKAR